MKYVVLPAKVVLFKDGPSGSPARIEKVERVAPAPAPPKATVAEELRLLGEAVAALKAPAKAKTPEVILAELAELAEQVEPLAGEIGATALHGAWSRAEEGIRAEGWSVEYATVYVKGCAARLREGA